MTPRPFQGARAYPHAVTSPPNDTAPKRAGQNPPASVAVGEAGFNPAWLASFMENLPGLAWIKDGDGRYVYANAAALTAFGKASTELYGRTDAEIFPPETAAQFSANDQAAMARANGIETVETLVHPDGTLHHSLVNKFSIRNAAGRTLVGGIAIDITDRRRAQDALDDSEARKSAIFESALDSIITIDHEGRVLEFNPAAERTFGYRREDALGRRLEDLIVPPSLREAHRQGLARYVATGEARLLNRRLEMTAQRADGALFPIELTVMRIPSAGPPIFTAYLSDITHKKESERALRASEGRFREAANSAPAPVWMTNSEGQIEFVNRALEDFAGKEFAGLMGNA